MIEGIDFFTPLIFERPPSGLEKAAEVVDGYFSFYEGKVAYVISPCDPQSHLSLALLESSHEGPQLGATVAKILSYYTLVIPLLMLALKAILRWSLSVRVIKRSDLRAGSLDDRTAWQANVFFRKSATNRGPQTFFDALPESLKEGYIPSRPLADFFKEKLSDLKYLNLSDSGIETIPDEIEYLFDLKSLNLSGNPIKTLPLSLQGLANLTSLDISRTNITSLPAHFALPISLKTITLSASQHTLEKQLIALAKEKRGGGAASAVLPLDIQIV